MSAIDRIPSGWRLNTVDCSIPGRCSAMLVRTPEYKAAWLAMPDHDRDHSPLYMSGNGKDFDSAIDEAISNLAPADLLPPATYVHTLGSAA